MKEIFERFSIVLLIGLLLIKVSLFHVYDHHDALDDSNDHCELCVLSIEGPHSESLIPPTTVVQYASPEVASQPNISLLVVMHVKTVDEGLPFSRPPPHQFA